MNRWFCLLEVKAAPDQDSLRCSYTYDDGRSKTVTEFPTIAIEGAGRQYTITSDGDQLTRGTRVVPGEEFTFGMVTLLPGVRHATKH